MKTESITLRITERLKKKVQAIAEGEQMSISEYITDLIKRDIEQREKGE